MKKIQQKVPPATKQEVDVAEIEGAAARHAALVAERESYHRADQEARQRIAGRSWDEAAFLAAGLTLGDSLRRKRREQRFLVHNMIGAKHNCSITGNNGVGKTTLGVNLLGALVDGEPFLDRQTNLPAGSRVEWWNGEMDADDFNDYARPLGIRARSRVVVRHLRDLRVSLMDDVIAASVVKALKEQDVSVWCVDSWARLCAWAGLSENKNEDVARLAAQVDQIKREAGVHSFVVLGHTGRGKPEEGDEHARGATTFDDWVDSRWLYVMPNWIEHKRFLYTPKVRGVRDADLLVGQQVLMDDDNHISLGLDKRSDAIDRVYLEALVAAVAAEPGLNTSQVAAACGYDVHKNGLGRQTGRHLTKAENEGMVHSEKGSRNAVLWFPGVADAPKLKTRRKR